MKNLIILSCIFYLFTQCCAYKPVILLHGILTGDGSMAEIEKRIIERHPGTIVYNVERFAGWSSLDNMWYQINQIGNNVLNISNSHPEGVHFLGYSQGGLVARGILQTFPEHNIHTFISLSSPQAGQYGAEFLHLIFPGMVCKTAFELFYSKVGQHTSVGNYWNDPHHQKLYYYYSSYLPYVNNEIRSAKSDNFTRGLKKLKRMVLIGGPDDGVITPWQSSQFGYYDQDENVLTLKQRDIYIKDTIGLKYLDENKRLTFVTVPNVTHYEWHLNVDIFDQHIIPYLD